MHARTHAHSPQFQSICDNFVINHFRFVCSHCFLLNLRRLIKRFVLMIQKQTSNDSSETTRVDQLSWNMIIWNLPPKKYGIDRFWYFLSRKTINGLNLCAVNSMSLLFGFCCCRKKEPKPDAKRVKRGDDWIWIAIIINKYALAYIDRWFHLIYS